MHITVENNLALLVTQVDELFRVVDCRVQYLRGIWPTSIQIDSHKIASIVPNYDAIRIEHRYNFEDESVSEELGVWIILLQEELDGALTHELGGTLTRMDS